MAAFRFELVSPERLMFSGQVESVVVPGTEGEFTVLKDHAPLMSTLKPGIVDIEETSSSRVKLFVRGGFADVSAQGMTILAEQAIPFNELDAARIEQQIRDAEEDVADATSDEARRLASEKLEQLRELRGVLNI